MFGKPSQVGVFVFLLLSAGPGVAQVSSAPIKPGLWETQITSSNVMSLPPETEARIAAMPPDQQSMVRARMGGKPVTTTHKGCAVAQSSLDSMLNDAQKRPGMKCTFTNRTQTSTTASFDTTCTMPEGTMKGHTEFRMADSEHVSGTTQMEGQMTGPNGGTTSMKINNQVTSKYLGADCGDVKPTLPDK
jgi:hypothetical protein